MQGRNYLRGTTLIYASPQEEARLHCADNGAARPELNALAPACSRAMFPCRADAAFHLPRLSWDGQNRVLSPSSHYLFILFFYFPVVKQKIPFFPL